MNEKVKKKPFYLAKKKLNIISWQRKEFSSIKTMHGCTFVQQFRWKIYEIEVRIIQKISPITILFPNMEKGWAQNDSSRKAHFKLRWGTNLNQDYISMLKN